MLRRPPGSTRTATLLPYTALCRSGAVEGLPVLGADAVGGDHGHDIGHAVAHHRALPHAAGVEVGVVRLVADGGGEEQDIRPHQHHRARGFGIPLIPADADADRPVARLPQPATGVAGPEIEFLLIARNIGNMDLPNDATHPALDVAPTRP